MPLNPIQRTNVLQMSQGIWWPRAMLLRGELAVALRQPDEARQWYDRVLALWASADAEFQPDVARIRAARAALGSPAAP